MRNLSPWPMLAMLLLGILFLREPRFQRAEENFLRWLLQNAQARGDPVPLTVIEIGRNPLEQKQVGEKQSTEAFLHGGGSTISPLEYALFLQSVLEFQPTVVAFENILKWRTRDNDQEQVFLDQAMRVPKLLLGAELTDAPDPDAPVVELTTFKQVSGRRGELPEFSGIGRQPGEDMRLISTLGFMNLLEGPNTFHVPLLFQYRGDVIPSFSLQALMLWLRVTPAEVKIELGSQILLPQGRRIPIRADGTVLVDPKAARKARRMTLNELLLAAQTRGENGVTTAHLENIHDQIVLARTPANPFSPPDVFAATIATIQSNHYVRRVSWIFDCAVILAVTALAGMLQRVSKDILFLGAIALTAAYCLAALTIISRWGVWIPGYLPLGAIWLIVLLNLFPRQKKAAREDAPDRSSVTPTPIG
jgi:hypothetical protein